MKKTPYLHDIFIIVAVLFEKRTRCGILGFHSSEDVNYGRLSYDTV
jgi:hypothetical protein